MSMYGENLSWIDLAVLGAFVAIVASVVHWLWDKFKKKDE